QHAEPESGVAFDFRRTHPDFRPQSDAIRATLRILIVRISVGLVTVALLAAAVPGVEQGVFPSSWITGGPNCLEVPAWQIHEYNPNLYILRESGCTHYEKPFLYLFFGADRALLIDTGAGASDAASVTGKLIAKWLKRSKREAIPLIVVHTHAHGDHTAG